MGNSKSKSEAKAKIAVADAQQLITCLEIGYPKIIQLLENEIPEFRKGIAFFQHLAESEGKGGRLPHLLEGSKQLSSQVNNLVYQVATFEKKLLENKSLHKELLEALVKYKDMNETGIDSLLKQKGRGLSELKRFLKRDERIAQFRQLKADDLEKIWEDAKFMKVLLKCITDMWTLQQSC